MPRYTVTIKLEIDAADKSTALNDGYAYVNEAQSALDYDRAILPGYVSARVLRADVKRGRQAKCRDCEGGKVEGHAVYPGSFAYRPLIDCPTCAGTGTVTTYR